MFVYINDNIDVKFIGSSMFILRVIENVLILYFCILVWWYEVCKLVFIVLLYELNMSR